MAWQTPLFNRLLSLFISLALFPFVGGALANPGEGFAISAGTSRGNGFGFRENKGQVSDQFHRPRPDVLYTGSDGLMSCHLLANGISYQLSKVHSWQQADSTSPIFRGKAEQFAIPDSLYLYRLDVRWPNANPHAAILRGEEHEGYDNFYLAVCPNGVIGVKTYSELTYQSLYPGIDLRWYMQDGRLKYDYEVAAGADYGMIEMELLGADSIRINAEGELVAYTPLGEVVEQAPLVIQEGRSLASKWVIHGNRVGFEILGLDAAKAFTIDPVVRLWGTYYGGSAEEIGMSCTTDNSNNLYLAGRTSGTLTGIATVGSHQTIYAGGQYDAMLVKFNSNGSRQWGTYYGGNQLDMGNWVACGAGGSIFMTGFTSSMSGITSSGSHQSTYGGGNYDAFLVNFDAQGVRQWGTYYGGSNDDIAYSCDTDPSGYVYIAGYSYSPATSIVTPGCHQSFLSGNTDAFLAKFDNNGTRVWATYYGGTYQDHAYCCDVDDLGNVYISGNSSSNNGISTLGCHQPSFSGTPGGGNQDMFLVKFNSLGVRQWGTYLGDLGWDYGFLCVADHAGNIYLAGQTASTNAISTPGCHQPNRTGAEDGCLVKFDGNGVRQWGTFYGGPYTEELRGCAVDLNNAVYIAGSTHSLTHIAMPNGFQNSLGGNKDAYLVKFDPAGVRLAATYYGGSGFDITFGCTTDLVGDAYLLGSTTSYTAISTPGSHQPMYGGGSINGDGFLAKFDGNLGPLSATQIGSLVVDSSGCVNATWKISAPVRMGTPTMSIDFPTANKAVSAHREGDQLVIDDLRFEEAGAYSGRVIVNGRQERSIELTVLPCSSSGISIYPNPFHQQFTLEFMAEVGGWAEICLVDVVGRQVATPWKGEMVEGSHFLLTLEPNIPAGVYFVERRIGPSVFRGRVVKE